MVREQDVNFKYDDLNITLFISLSCSYRNTSTFLTIKTSYENLLAQRPYPMFTSKSKSNLK